MIHSTPNQPLLEPCHATTSFLNAVDYYMNMMSQSFVWSAGPSISLEAAPGRLRRDGRQDRPAAGRNPIPDVVPLAAVPCVGRRRGRRQRAEERVCREPLLRVNVVNTSVYNSSRA